MARFTNNGTSMGQRLSERGVWQDKMEWKPYETHLIDVLKELYSEEEWLVEDHPLELSGFFGINPDNNQELGIKPDAKLTNIRTGKFVYIEVKFQGAYGNAEERGTKTFTPTFQDSLNSWIYDNFDISLDYHPYVILFTGALAVLPRYTQKFSEYYEEGSYCLWKGIEEDGTGEPDREILHDFMDRFIEHNRLTEDVDGDFDYLDELCDKCDKEVSIWFEKIFDAMYDWGASRHGRKVSDEETLAFARAAIDDALEAMSVGDNMVFGEGRIMGDWKTDPPVMPRYADMYISDYDVRFVFSEPDEQTGNVIVVEWSEMSPSGAIHSFMPR